MSLFGVDVFGYTNQLFNSDDEPKEPPKFQDVIEGDAIREDLGMGGRWGDRGKSLSLMDEDTMYVVVSPGWDMSVKVKDLESGEEKIKSTSPSMPVIQVAGVNGVVRLKQLKDPEGNVYDYGATPLI